MNFKPPNIVTNTIAIPIPKSMYFRELIVFILLAIIHLSCSSQEQIENQVVVDTRVDLERLIPEDMPAPILAKYISSDSVKPAVEIPLIKEPKRVPAHPNIHPVIQPDLIPITTELTVFTPGKNGILLPETRPAEFERVPAYHPEPNPARALRAADAAIYDIRYLSEDEGLDKRVIPALMEDSRGHLWFSDPNSIVRYDGENFFEYTPEHGFPQAASDIIEDQEGNIWFTNNSGVFYYDGQYVNQFSPDERFEDITRSGLMQDSKGFIWFSLNGSVYKYDGQNFTIFKPENGLINDGRKDQAFFSDNQIVDITEDSQGNMWWASRGNGVLRYDGQTITHFTEKDGLAHNYISTIVEDRLGNLWFCSGGQNIPPALTRGVSRYTPPPSSGLTGAKGHFANFTTEHGLSGNRIEDMIMDQSGDLWFGTFGDGLCQYNGQAFIHYGLEEGLNQPTVIKLLEDRQGNIWAGMNINGLNRIKPHGFRHFTKKQGLSENRVGNPREDQKGNIWIGTLYGGVIKYDGIFFTHYTAREGLVHNPINGLSVDSRGNIWMATRDIGIIRLDPDAFGGRGSLTYFTTEQGLGANNSWDIHIDSQDRLWHVGDRRDVGSWEEAVVTRLDLNTNQFTHFIGDVQYEIGHGHIFEDSRQNVWVGGKGWVARHNSSQDELQLPYQVDTTAPNYIINFLEESEDYLWFGSATQLVRIPQYSNAPDSAYVRLTQGSGFPEWHLASLAKDHQQNIWVSSANRGLGVLQGGINGQKGSNINWLSFTKPDGLKTNTYSFNGVLLDSKKRMWWTSDDGLTMLDLKHFQLPSNPPDIGLSHLDINDQFIDFQRFGQDSSFMMSTPDGKKINRSFTSTAPFRNYPVDLKLPYDLNHLVFHFSAIDWTAPEDIRYSFRIRELDEKWSPPQTEAKADYRNLPFGDFTFEVRAMGKTQEWSEPMPFSFTVRPPWWHTWWAYTIYALVFIGIWGGILVRLRLKVKQKQAQLEREQAMRLELSEANQKLVDFNKANSRFVPDQFLQTLGKKSIIDLKLGDQTAVDMTILFADIRNYTGISEKLSPEENFKLINTFLGKLGPIIQKYGGFINQYLGDGIMALFKDDHNGAVLAAIEIQKALQRFNRQRELQGKEPIEAGIGLNTGKLMLGIVGDEKRFDACVISDAVNTASRLEGLTKVFGSKVIISEKTLAELAINDLLNEPEHVIGDFRFLGKVKVKGKNEALKIYDFFGGDPLQTRNMKIENRARFEKAIEYYFNRKFGKAADLLKELKEQCPDDKAIEYYMSKSVKYIMEGVDNNWNGVEEMISK